MPHHDTAMPADEQSWHYARERAWLYLVLLVLALAGIVAWTIAFDPRMVLGVCVGVALLIPALAWPQYKMLSGRRLVTVSDQGITPHEWARSPIAWSLVRSIAVRRHGAHRYLVLDLAPEATAAIKPWNRLVLAMTRWARWLPGGWHAAGVSIALSMLAANDASALLATLARRGLVPTN